MLKEWKGFFQKSTGRVVTPGRDLGFSMVELMVVVAIIAILALGMFGISRNPITDVKGAIFNLRSDLALARAVATKENKPVLVEFDSDMDDHLPGPPPPFEFSYRICTENYNDPALMDNDCADVDADAGEEDEDVVIKEVVFNEIVEFYDDDPIVNAGVGPDIVFPATDATVWPEDTTGDNDGLTFPENVAFNNDYIIFRPDGSCDASGVIYLYAPDPADGGANLRTPPLALRVSISGVMQIRRWDGSIWNSK